MIAAKTSLKYLLYLLAIILILSWPQLTSNNFYLRISIIVGIYIILVLGLNLLMGYAGQISLGHAAFYGLGAYGSGILTTRYGLSVWLAILLAALATALVAYIIGLPTLRLRGHYLAMATLGFGEILNILFGELNEFTGGMDGLRGIPAPSLAGIPLDTYRTYYFLVWIIVVLLLILAVNIANSRVGRALRAVHGSRIAAEAIGVNTAKYKVQVFVLSAIYASIAGSLYAHLTNFISPESFSLVVSIFLVVMVVVGGMTSIWGAVVGAASLTIFAEYSRGFEDYSHIVYAVVLISVVIFLPQGVVPGLAKLWRKLNRRFHSPAA